MARRGCIISRINPQPALASVVMHTLTVAEFGTDPTEVIATGDWTEVNAHHGIVEVTRKIPNESSSAAEQIANGGENKHTDI